MWEYTDAPFVFPIVFTPLGLVILCFGIWGLGKSLRVRIDADSVKARRYLFNYPITTKVYAIDTITSLEVKKGASMSSGNKTTVYYALVAHTSNAEKIVIGERLTSKPEVQLLEKSIRQYFPALTQ